MSGAGGSRLLPWLAALALGALGYALGARRAAAPQPEASAARPSQPAPARPVAGARIVALARLEPQSEVSEVAAPPGDLVAKVLVREGQWVERGAPLCELASRPARQAEFDAAARLVKEAELRLAAESQLASAKVREANAELARLEASLAREQSRLSRRCELGQVTLDRASATLKRRSAAGRVFTREEEKNARLDQKKARAELALARAELETFKVEATRRRSLYLTRLVSAKAQLSVSQTSALGSLRAKLAASQAVLEATLIRAPAAGEVLQLLARPGQASGPGALLRLGDTRRMVAVAEVDQADVRRVRVGQRATVRSPALAAELSGRVVQIGHSVYRRDVFGDDPLAPHNARVIPVRVLLDPTSAASRLTNLECEAEIELAPAGEQTPPGDAAPPGSGTRSE